MEELTIIELLNLAKSSASLEYSDFDEIFLHESRVPYPTCEKEVTNFVKDRVLKHNRTWIVRPIVIALEKIAIQVKE